MRKYDRFIYLYRTGTFCILYHLNSIQLRGLNTLSGIGKILIRFHTNRIQRKFSYLCFDSKRSKRSVPYPAVLNTGSIGVIEKQKSWRLLNSEWRMMATVWKVQPNNFSNTHQENLETLTTKHRKCHASLNENNGYENSLTRDQQHSLAVTGR